jgi:hypothetical protein
MSVPALVKTDTCLLYKACPSSATFATADRLAVGSKCLLGTAAPKDARVEVFVLLAGAQVIHLIAPKVTAWRSRTGTWLQFIHRIWRAHYAGSAAVMALFTAVLTSCTL